MYVCVCVKALDEKVTCDAPKVSTREPHPGGFALCFSFSTTRHTQLWERTISVDGTVDGLFALKEPMGNRIGAGTRNVRVPLIILYCFSQSRTVSGPHPIQFGSPGPRDPLLARKREGLLFDAFTSGSMLADDSLSRGGIPFLGEAPDLHAEGG